MALEVGPQLVRHDRSWTGEGGERRSCRYTWIAEPDETSGTVQLTPVTGREQIDSTLKTAAERWLARHRVGQFDEFRRVLGEP